MSSKRTWIATASLAFIFFLYGHDFVRAREAQYEGYPTGDIIARSIEHGSSQGRIGILLLAAFGGALLVYGKRARLRVNGILGTTIVFNLLWALASIAWTDDLGLTFRRLLQLAILWLAALGIAAWLSLRRIICVAFCVSTLFLLSGVCAELLLGTFHPFQAEVQYAGLDTGYRFSGTIDPNLGAWELGTMVMSAVFLSFTFRRYRILFCAAALSAFLFMILSKTRTSVAALSTSLIACWLLVMSRRILLVVTLSTVSLIGSLYLTFGDTLVGVTQRALLLGREDSAATASTLTGRIPLWTGLLSFDIPEHPLVGYGYAAFWTPTRIVKFSQGGASALNGYIDITLELGIVGVAAYVLMLVLGAIKSVGLYKRSGDLEYLFIFVMIVFHSITMVNDSANNIVCFPTFIVLSLLAKLGFDESCSAQQFPQVLKIRRQAISAAVQSRLQRASRLSTEGV